MIKPVIGLSMNYMKLGSFHQLHIRDTYVDTIIKFGGIPLLIPCVNDPEIVDQYLDMVDFLIMIGGLDYPPEMYGQKPHPSVDIAHERRVKSDPVLFTRAKEREIPILGICAGLQLMNIVSGGQLIQHLETVDYHLGETYHHVSITGGKWLKRIFGKSEISTNSNHHQGANPLFIGNGFEAVAYAEDGVIEAIEYTGDQFILGIQWHPERIKDTPHQKKLFGFLIKKALEYRLIHKKTEEKESNTEDN